MLQSEWQERWYNWKNILLYQTDFEDSRYKYPKPEGKNCCLCNGHDILAPYFDFEGFNPVKNIWNKIDKSSKTGQEKKILITTLNCFPTAIAKVYFLKGRLGNMSPPKFEIFLHFLIS